MRLRGAKHWLGAIAVLALAACAQRPVAPAPPARVAIPPSLSNAGAGLQPPNAVGSFAGTEPHVAMPGEWRHLAAEDYDDLFDRMRAGFALDEVQEPAVDEQLRWFEHNPDYLERTFQRAQRYMYYVVTEVEARGMPLEFALLPVVESAYEPFAFSRSRAAGLWQFMPATGARFGLKQDWWYDGRRDVIESTRAALDYLQALHDQFGDWLLAIAAYNVGEVAIQRQVDSNRAAGLPSDFWHLKLPAETRAYVPKLLALKRLMAEPERYGLAFAPIPNEPDFAVIDIGSQIDLKIAAKLAGTTYDEISALNPGFNRWATDPDGPQRLLVPIEGADPFEAALKTLAPDERVQYVMHEVARRETLAAIARQYGTTATVIAKINDLKSKRLRPGESLRIPETSGDVPARVLLAASRVDRPQPERSRHGRRIVYRVRAGETLSAIARRHRMSVDTLARMNNLGPGDTIVAGQRLVLVRVSERRYVGAGGPGTRRVLYRVRRGDSVYSISRQFQVTITQLKNWNGLNARHLIRAGQRLVMYVDPNRTEG